MANKVGAIVRPRLTDTSTVPLNLSRTALCKSGRCGLRRNYSRTSGQFDQCEFSSGCLLNLISGFVGNSQEMCIIWYTHWENFWQYTTGFDTERVMNFTTSMKRSTLVWFVGSTLNIFASCWMFGTETLCIFIFS